LTHHHGPIKYLHIVIIALGHISPVPTRGFWGLSPQAKLQPLQIETGNTINQLRFCQFLDCHALPHKPKASPQKCKAPLVKTFWRWFWATYCYFESFSGNVIEAI